eukprot:2422365-Pleurochrysis_carterae.AAC.1
MASLIYSSIKRAGSKHAKHKAWTTSWTVSFNKSSGASSSLKGVDEVSCWQSIIKVAYIVFYCDFLWPQCVESSNVVYFATFVGSASHEHCRIFDHTCDVSNFEGCRVQVVLLQLLWTKNTIRAGFLRPV